MKNTGFAHLPKFLVLSNMLSKFFFSIDLEFVFKSLLCSELILFHIVRKVFKVDQSCIHVISVWSVYEFSISAPICVEICIPSCSTHFMEGFKSLLKHQNYFCNSRISLIIFDWCFLLCLVNFFVIQATCQRIFILLE